MSTRSRIGMVKEDGKVISIYCHWDGYPSHNGRILLENYKDAEKVGKLISLGDISILGDVVDIPEGLKHSFSSPIEGITVAYGRDRGEDGVDARTDEDEKAFWNSDFEEYGYIFKDGKWYFSSSYNPNPKELTEADCR